MSNEKVNLNHPLRPPYWWRTRYEELCKLVDQSWHVYELTSDVLVRARVDTPRDRAVAEADNAEAQAVYNALAEALDTFDNAYGRVTGNSLYVYG